MYANEHEVKRGRKIDIEHVTTATGSVPTTAPAVTSKDFDGIQRTLVHKHNGRPVVHGEVIKDFRGEKERVVGGRAPHRPSSTGFVWTQPLDPERTRYGRSGFNEVYPTGYSLEWRVIGDVKSEGPNVEREVIDLAKQLVGKIVQHHDAGSKDYGDLLDVAIEELAVARERK